MLARVAVGISYYNPGKFLRPAIQSVFAQSLQDWQLVLAGLPILTSQRESPESKERSRASISEKRIANGAF